MTAPVLRPYQRQAVERVERAWAAGERATLVAAAVGTGKSWIIAELARRAEQRCWRALVVAHRGELLEQNADKLRQLGADVALEKAADHAPRTAPIVMASIQTLQGRRLESWPRDHFGVVLVDEAHRALADSYTTLLAHFASARVAGLTGTPSRTDGQALGRVFESCAFSYSLRQAIGAGWLAPLQARRVIVEAVDLDRVGRSQGDLDAADLSREFTSPAAIDGVVRPLLELAPGRRSVLFASSVEHARLLTEAIARHEPGRAAWVSGETPAAERGDILARFRAGALRVVACRDLYLEGLDVPEISCVALARPTSSRIVFEQAIGRGTRLSPGKSECLILDFTANTRRHSLASVAAILAGTDDPPEVVERAAATDGDVIEALEQARRELGRGKVVGWVTELVDLFGGQIALGIDDPLPATPKQLAVLDRSGLAAPEGLGRRQASKVIGQLVARREAGLATAKQVRLLARHSIDARRMGFDEASARISRLMTRWRRPRREVSR